MNLCSIIEEDYRRENLIIKYSNISYGCRVNVTILNKYTHIEKYYVKDYKFEIQKIDTNQFLQILGNKITWILQTKENKGKKILIFASK